MDPGNTADSFIMPGSSGITDDTLAAGRLDGSGSGTCQWLFSRQPYVKIEDRENAERDARNGHDQIKQVFRSGPGSLRHPHRGMGMGTADGLSRSFWSGRSGGGSGRILSLVRGRRALLLRGRRWGCVHRLRRWTVGPAGPVCICVSVCTGGLVCIRASVRIGSLVCIRASVRIGGLACIRAPVHAGRLVRCPVPMGSGNYVRIGRGSGLCCELRAGPVIFSCGFGVDQGRKIDGCMSRIVRRS